MGTLYRLRTGDVLDDGDGLPEGPADPWQTMIGRVIAELSTPSRPHERTPFRCEDAEVLLKHLLRSRHAAYWDDSACRRIRGQILSRMVLPKPTNDEFVERKVEQVRTVIQSEAGSRASRTWVEGPLDAFERAIRSGYADRNECLNETRLAYFRAAFIACLFEANCLPTPSEAPRVPAPAVLRTRRP